ncbi:CDP-alcohol phosphatidyltransferase family protein [Glutamicibacter creatinolyticus]
MTPNQVTLSSMVISFAGIALIAWGPPNIAMCLTAVLLLLLGYALDSADGQLARLLGTGGPAGEWLDHVVDALRLPAFHLGVAVGLYLRPEAQTWTVGLAAGFALLASTWFIGQLLAEKLGPSHIEAPGGNAPAWVSFLKQPYDVSTTFFTILFLPWLEVFLLVYGALFIFTFAVACVSLWRKHAWLAQSASALPQREA